MMRCLFLALLLSSQILQAQFPLKQSFGQGGKLRLQPDDYNEVADVQAVGQDSLLVLMYAGHSGSQFYDMDVVLAALDGNGNLLSGFGQNGMLRFDFEGMDYSTARRLQRDNAGNWLVLGSGYALGNPGYAPFCIKKIHQDGITDSSFGVNGTARIAFYGGNEFPGVLKNDSSGRILLAGGSYDTIGGHNVPVAGRFWANGVPDSTFGGTGKEVIDFTFGMQPLRIDPHLDLQHLTGGEIYDLVPLAAGDMLVAGSYGNSAFVARLNTNGQPDSAFHNIGYTVFQVEQLYNNRVEGLLLLPDSTVLMAVAVDKTTDRDFHLVRISAADGSVLGSEYVDFNGSEDWFSCFALAPSGMVYVAGRSMTTVHAQQPAYRSDWFSLVTIPDFTNLSLQYKQLAAFDPGFQSGASALTVLGDGNLACAGFVHTAQPGKTDGAVFVVDASMLMGLPETAGSLDSLSVFPVPFTTEITIGLPEASSTASVFVCDGSGRLLYAESIKGGKNRLNLGDAIAPGLYQIIVEEKGKVYPVTRVVKLKE